MAIMCTKCKKTQAKHIVGVFENLCCECYVNEGNPPADWHPDCIKAYEQYKQNEISNGTRNLPPTKGGEGGCQHTQQHFMQAGESYFGSIDQIIAFVNLPVHAFNDLDHRKELSKRLLETKKQGYILMKVDNKPTNSDKDQPTNSDKDHPTDNNLINK